MTGKEQIRISGSPAGDADAAAILARFPHGPIYIDFLIDSARITVQANLVNRCWQVFRVLPDGNVEFIAHMFPPHEAVSWWLNEAGNPEWYAGQCWNREKSERRQLLRRLILLLLAGLILIAGGVALISAGLAR